MPTVELTETEISPSDTATVSATNLESLTETEISPSYLATAHATNLESLTETETSPSYLAFSPEYAQSMGKNKGVDLRGRGLRI